MVLRKIIHIDEKKCDGCGLCVDACHEGAIQLVDGKARLVSDIYCDGLGDCLSECPQGAITIEEREARPYDEAAVEAQMKAKEKPRPHLLGGCPGSALREFKPQGTHTPLMGDAKSPSQLGNWPIQLKLVPPAAPFLKGAHLLICADCVPFAVPDFHARYLSGKALLVGCPKLDDLPFYLEKLKAIFAEAAPEAITVLKMEVPCCSGIAQAALQAREETAPEAAAEVITFGLRGAELCREKM